MQEEAATATAHADSAAGNRASTDRTTDRHTDSDFGRRPGATDLADDRRHLDFDRRDWRCAFKGGEDSDPNPSDILSPGCTRRGWIGRRFSQRNRESATCGAGPYQHDERARRIQG